MSFATIGVAFMVGIALLILGLGVAPAVIEQTSITMNDSNDNYQNYRLYKRLSY